MVSEKNNPKEVSIFSDISNESIDAMLKAGRIYASLKPRLNAVYDVKVVSLPKAFDSKSYGIAFSLNIEHDGMIKSLVLAKSFRTQLKAEMIRESLVDSLNEPDFNLLWLAKEQFAFGNIGSIPGLFGEQTVRVGKSFKRGKQVSS